MRVQQDALRQRKSQYPRQYEAENDIVIIAVLFTRFGVGSIPANIQMPKSLSRSTYAPRVPGKHTQILETRR